MGFQSNAFQGNAFEDAGGGAAPEVDASRSRTLMGVGRVVLWGLLVRLLVRGLELIGKV